jgi:hypothetical protein
MTCAEGAIKRQRQKGKKEVLSPVASAIPGDREAPVMEKRIKRQKSATVML